MTTASLFQWVLFKQDVRDSVVKAGDRGVVVDLLPPNPMQAEIGYTLEVFREGETLDVVSVPASWVKLLPEMWGKSIPNTASKETRASRRAEIAQNAAQTFAALESGTAKRGTLDELEADLLDSEI